MADQLYVSYKLRGFSSHNMLRHYERMLRVFPFSRLAKVGASLRVVAVRGSEAPLLERAFEYPVDVDGVIKTAGELLAPDCATQLEAHWDLWQYSNDWVVTPSAVELSCFGPEFEDADGTHLQIGFGVDIPYLPQPDLPNFLFMARSNIRSLLHLVSELDKNLNVESRRLWTESGENFAERLHEVLAEHGIQ